MQQQQEIDIKDELVMWGFWSRTTGLNLSMSSGSVFVPQISDERAMAIDRVVAILSHKDELAGSVLKFTYIQRLTTREIAKRKGVNKDKVNTLLSVAVGCVEVGLEVQAANDSQYVVRKNK